ncbi:MAG: VOC family protein [Brevibacterium sp.]
MTGEAATPAYPVLLHTAIDTTEPRQLAEFYRQLLGYIYRPGDEPSSGGLSDTGNGQSAGEEQCPRDGPSAGDELSAGNRPGAGDGQTVGNHAVDEPVESDWLVLTDGHGRRKLAFQKVDHLEPTTWPKTDVPTQMHLDFTVMDRTELARHRHRAEELGAELLFDRSDDVDEPLYVFTDPAGHPFCIFVA